MGIGCASKMADSSPAKMKSEQQLGDVSSILQKLKDEVAYLQDEVEAKGAGFYVPLANQLNATRAAMEELTCTLDSCNGGLRSKDADMIPAAVGGAGAVDGESDFGKSIRLIQKSASGARAAYQYASVSAKGLVEDADKLDIVVKACQTEYIKLKLLNNNAKAYVNAKRLKWQRQADCFRYWAEFVHYETIGEAGKRLKAFLASKLASTLRKCYTGIIRNHDNIAAENMKNNDKAKKVGLMLEKIARGLVHRCFNAFIRYFQDMAEERAAQDAINAALAGMDEANKAKLRVFLMGKEKQKMMMFFKQWVEVAQSKGLLELYEMLDKEEAGRKAAEDELAKLLAESGDAGNALKGLEDEITHEQSELQKLVSAYKGMGGELRRLLKQIKETEGDLESEHCLRQEQQEKNYALRDELAAVTAVRDELAAELMGVAGDVSNVHEEAKFE